MNGKKAQVWIETVVYTLIGIALIALVLGYVIPKVNKAKDTLAVEQSIRSLQTVDEKILAVMSAGDGNVRSLEYSIKRGTLIINSSNDIIQIIIPDMSQPYSEVNIPIVIGPVTLVSNKTQRSYNARLTLDYGFNITYAGKDNGLERAFTPSSTPYLFTFTNINNSAADIKEISQG